MLLSKFVHITRGGENTFHQEFILNPNNGIQEDQKLKIFISYYVL